MMKQGFHLTNEIKRYAHCSLGFQWFNKFLYRLYRYHLWYGVRSYSGVPVFRTIYFSNGITENLSFIDGKQA